MNELEIVNLYKKTNQDRNSRFSENINSSLRVKTAYDRVNTSFEWLEIMEETIRYLDNILRNPNRFIINEEDIVKIELARRVTVESIKHLSKNTNLIQDYNKETGDVRPSKILNINKEESFDTYENRFIYSLIKNMKFFIERKKKNLITESYSKDDKTMEYTAKSSIDNENIDISMTINSKKDDKKNIKDESGLTIPERIERLETQISDLTSSSVYQIIDKKHISLVTSPIKKTNVILKNVNFQYAVKLWNYMQNHMEDDTKKEKKNNDYYDDGNIKKLIDESFLLDYLVLDTINREEEKYDKKALSEKIVGNMIEKMITIDSTIDEKKLKEIIDKQYSIIKYKTVVNEKQIEEVYKKYMDKYLEKIKMLEI